MLLNEYQEKAMKTAIYPNKGDNIMYPLLGLVNECGEVAGALKKASRDDGNIITPDRKKKMVGEIGDVLWYVAAMGSELGIRLDEAVRGERFCDINESKFIESSLLFEKTIQCVVLSLQAEAARVTEMFVYAAYYGRDKTYFQEMSKEDGVAATRLGNVIMLLSDVAILLDTTLEEIAKSNLNKLDSRAARGVLKGDGGER